jgi:hypothetical protein
MTVQPNQSSPAPTPNTRATIPLRRSSAIIRGATVEKVATQTIRWTSLAILACSFVGAIIAFNGRWPSTWRVWEQVSIVALVGGLLLQVFCTLMEWANRKRRHSPRYFVPLILDVGSTYIGFAPLIAPFFRDGLARAGLPDPLPSLLAHAGVILLSLWFAYYPEQNLIED